MVRSRASRRQAKIGFHLRHCFEGALKKQKDLGEQIIHRRVGRVGGARLPQVPFSLCVLAETQIGSS
jgi:hypothetical protein